jgi:predicted hydrocarbon binding protein
MVKKSLAPILNIKNTNPILYVRNTGNLAYNPGMDEEDRKYIYSTIEDLIKILNKVGFGVQNVDINLSAISDVRVAFNCNFISKPKDAKTFIALARRAILMEELDETSDKNTK